MDNIYEIRPSTICDFNQGQPYLRLMQGVYFFDYYVVYAGHLSDTELFAIKLVCLFIVIIYCIYLNKETIKILFNKYIKKNT